MDAHPDTGDTMFGEKIAHGTPFRRAVEEGVLDPKYTVQIGLRGTGYSPHDLDWPKEQVINQLSFYRACTQEESKHLRSAAALS